MNEKASGGAAEWILFFENQMNCAIEAARPRGYDPSQTPRSFMGWHRQQDYHVAGFFDGHAAYRHHDTRYIDGRGWTTWPNRPWLEHWREWEAN